MQVLGQKLINNQEVMARMSNMLMEIYAMESAVVRAERMLEDGHRWSELARDFTELYVNEAWHRIPRRRRMLCADVVEGEALRHALAGIRAFAEFHPTSSARLPRPDRQPADPEGRLPDFGALTLTRTMERAPIGALSSCRELLRARAVAGPRGGWRRAAGRRRCRGRAAGWSVAPRAGIPGSSPGAGRGMARTGALFARRRRFRGAFRAPLHRAFPARRLDPSLLPAVGRGPLLAEDLPAAVFPGPRRRRLPAVAGDLRPAGVGGVGAVGRHHSEAVRTTGVPVEPARRRSSKGVRSSRGPGGSRRITPRPVAAWAGRALSSSACGRRRPAGRRRGTSGWGCEKI